MTKEYTIVCPFCSSDDISFMTNTGYEIGLYQCHNDNCIEMVFKAELTKSAD